MVYLIQQYNDHNMKRSGSANLRDRSVSPMRRQGRKLPSIPRHSSPARSTSEINFPELSLSPTRRGRLAAGVGGGGGGVGGGGRRRERSMSPSYARDRGGGGYADDLPPSQRQQATTPRPRSRTSHRNRRHTPQDYQDMGWQDMANGGGGGGGGMAAAGHSAAVSVSDLSDDWC